MTTSISTETTSSIPKDTFTLTEKELSLPLSCKAKQLTGGTPARYGQIGDKAATTNACMSGLPIGVFNKKVKSQPSQLFVQFNGVWPDRKVDILELAECPEYIDGYAKNCVYNEHSLEWLTFLLTDENFKPIVDNLYEKDPVKVQEAGVCIWKDATQVPCDLLSLFSICLRTAMEKPAVYWRFHYLKEYCEPRMAFLLAQLNHPTSKDFEKRWVKHHGHHIMFVRHLERKVKRWMAADPKPGRPFSQNSSYGSEDIYDTDMKFDFITAPQEWDTLKEMIDYYRSFV